MEREIASCSYEDILYLFYIYDNEEKVTTKELLVRGIFTTNNNEELQKN